MFDLPPQQPQSVADLLGRSFRIFRQHYRLFVRAQIAPSIAVTVGRIVMQEGASSFGKSFAGAHSNMPALLGFGSLTVIGALVAVVSYFVLSLRNLAFVRLALGFSPSYEEAAAAVNDRKWMVLGVALAAFAAILGLIILWVIEIGISIVLWKSLPIVAALGAVFGGIGLLLCTTTGHVFVCVALASTACEKEPFTEIISRTFSLIWHDLGRVLLFCLLLLITMYLIGCALAVPLVVLSMFEFFRQGIPADGSTPHVKMPFYYLLVSQIWESLINMFVSPVTFVAYGLIYNDLRIRQEGLDVVRNLRAISPAARNQTPI